MSYRNDSKEKQGLPPHSPSVQKWMSRGGKIPRYDDGGPVESQVNNILSTASKPVTTQYASADGSPAYGSSGDNSAPSSNPNTQTMQPSSGTNDRPFSKFGGDKNTIQLAFGGKIKADSGDEEYSSIDGYDDDEEEDRYADGGMVGHPMVALVKAIRNRGKSGR